MTVLKARAITGAKNYRFFKISPGYSMGWAGGQFHVWNWSGWGGHDNSPFLPTPLRKQVSPERAGLPDFSEKVKQTQKVKFCFLS